MFQNDAVKWLVLILCIDVMFFLGQVSLDNINSGGITLVEHSFISDVDSGNYDLDTNPALKLPEREGGVASGDSTNIFTDAFNSVRDWLLDTTGLNYVLSFVAGPVPYLASAGLPQPFLFAIGALWYLLTIFMLILVIAGRL